MICSVRFWHSDALANLKIGATDKFHEETSFRIVRLADSGFQVKLVRNPICRICQRLTLCTLFWLSETTFQDRSFRNATRWLEIFLPTERIQKTPIEDGRYPVRLLVPHLEMRIVVPRLGQQFMLDNAAE